MAHWIEGKGWSDNYTPRHVEAPKPPKPREPKKGVRNMIKTATQMRREMESNDEYQNRLRNAIRTIMSKIETAAKDGRDKIYFTPPADLYDEVKTAFEGYGYVFTKVGFEGGVWQDCEYICW